MNIFIPFKGYFRDKGPKAPMVALAAAILVFGLLASTAWAQVISGPTVNGAACQPSTIVIGTTTPEFGWTVDSGTQSYVRWFHLKDETASPIWIYPPFIAETAPVIATGHTWDAVTPKAYIGSTFTYGGYVRTFTEGNTYEWQVSIYGDAESNMIPDTSPYCSFRINKAPTATAPKTDGQTDPGSVTSATPALSWTFTDLDGGDTQAKYRIVMDTDPDKLDFIQVPFWDSTEVSSSSTSKVYDGPALEGGATYYWKVKVWDNNNVENSGAVSVQAQFTTVATGIDHVYDGTGADVDYWTTSNTQFSANWSSSAADHYEIGISIGTTWPPTGPSSVLGYVTSYNFTSISPALVDGTYYYTIVRAMDGGGGQIAIANSNGFTMDASPPLAITGLVDGAGADEDYSTSTTEMAAHWDATSDPNTGILRYEYAVGIAPGGTTIRDWTSTGTDTSVAASGLPLVSGTKYYFSVKAYNNAGLANTAVSSDGFTVDTTAPSTIATVNDGTGADLAYVSSATQLSGNWTASTDAQSGIAEYMYAIGSTQGGVDIKGWTSAGLSTSVTATTLTLEQGLTYYFSVKAVNGAGIESTAANSNGAVVDTSPPDSVAGVIDGIETDQDFTTNPTLHECSWGTSSDLTSGIARYEYAFGTTEGGTELTSGWVDAGLSVDVTRDDLGTMTDMTEYYCTVKAVNGAGLESEPINSDGVTKVTAPVITSTAPASAVVGTPYAYTATATGTPPVEWSKTAGPDDFSINTNTGVVTWTPSTVGTFDITIRAENIIDFDEQSFQVTVRQLPAITSTASLTGITGQAYVYDTAGVAGAAEATGTTPITWSVVGDAPAGFSINSGTGAITWTPAASGSFDITIRATNAAGTADQPFTVVVKSPPVITSTAPDSAVINTAYIYTATASGSTPITWSVVGDAPTGFSINSGTGAITWTPTAEGVYDVTIQASNDAGTDTELLHVTVTASAVAPTITSTAGLTATVGTPYVYDTDNIATASGTEPFTWSRQSGPDEFTINENTGLISWTPVLSGNIEITIRAVNTAGFDDDTFTVAVTPTGDAPVITSTAELNAVFGEAYMYDADGIAEATGALPITWSVVGDAPAGFSINSGTGTITWTPAAEGEIPITIRASNAIGTDDQEFTVTVRSAPTIISEPNTNVVMGTEYLYDEDGIADALGTPDITWSVLPGGPDGFSINAATGAVTWTPTATGEFPVTIQAANAAGIATQEFTITVTESAEPPEITSVAGTTAVVGSAYSYDANNRPEATGTPPITWSALTGAPTGFVINSSTGIITWTPTAAGSFDVTIRATNSAGYEDQSFTIVVTTPGEAPTITSVASEEAVVGEAYLYDADGAASATGTAPITWSVLTGAPTGFAINSTTGAVTWTPTAAGSFDVTIRATNAQGSADQTFTIVVSETPTAPQITSTGSTSGVVGTAYLYDADGIASATGTAPITWSVLTGAPTGFTINSSTGAITWTPAAAGSFDVTIRATNAGGQDDESFTIIVTAAAVAPAITSTGSTSGVVGVAYSYDADGTASATGTTPITWSVLTGAPTGFTIDPNTGAITWTPADAGSFDVTIRATNAGGQDDESFTIIVTAAAVAPTITSTPALYGVVGTAYAYDADGTASATGTTPITWSVLTGAPTGFAIDPDTGAITWTPDAAGVFNITIRAENSADFDDQTFSVTVLDQGEGIPPTITSTAVTTAVVGQAYSYTVTAAGTEPIEFLLIEFPTGMTINSLTGVISWTPAQAGTFDVHVRASSESGVDDQEFTITVSNPLITVTADVTQSMVLFGNVTDAEAAKLGAVYALVDGQYVEINPMTDITGPTAVVAHPIEGFEITPPEPEASYEFAVVEGWNLVVNPFPGAIEFADANISFKPQGQATAQPLSQAIPIAPYAYIIQNNTYRMVPDEVEQIPAFAGFMIYSTGAGTLIIE